MAPRLFHYLILGPDLTKLSHIDAELFSVWQADAKDESGFIGYCYLDLFPRGKLIHLTIS